MLHFYRFCLPACQMSPFLIRLAPLGTFPPGEGRALPRQCKNGRRVPCSWRYGARAHPYGQWGGLDGVIFIARLCLGWKLTEDIWGGMNCATI